MKVFEVARTWEQWHSDGNCILGRRSISLSLHVAGGIIIGIIILTCCCTLFLRNKCARIINKLTGRKKKESVWDRSLRFFEADFFSLISRYYEIRENDFNLREIYIQEVSSSRYRGRTEEEASEKITEKKEKDSFARIGRAGSHRADYSQGAGEIGRSNPLLQMLQKKEEKTQETDTMIHMMREKDRSISKRVNLNLFWGILKKISISPNDNFFLCFRSRNPFFSLLLTLFEEKCDFGRSIFTLWLV